MVGKDEEKEMKKVAKDEEKEKEGDEQKEGKEQVKIRSRSVKKRGATLFVVHYLQIVLQLAGNLLSC